MDYTLAKELKGAGFPQEGNGTRPFDPSDSVYVPTLEELIEACGDDIEGLDRDKDAEKEEWYWTAYAFTLNEGRDAASPIEAIAKLWLALQAAKQPQTPKENVE